MNGYSGLSDAWARFGRQPKAAPPASSRRNSRRRKVEEEAAGPLWIRMVKEEVLFGSVGPGVALRVLFLQKTLSDTPSYLL